MIFFSLACIQDLIYHIRARFNTDFELLHKQKIQVINGLRERNRQIREMMMELGINETLWEPSLECMEQPEILLNVDDSEVTNLLKTFRQLTTSRESSANRCITT